MKYDEICGLKNGAGAFAGSDAGAVDADSPVPTFDDCCCSDVMMKLLRWRWRGGAWAECEVQSYPGPIITKRVREDALNSCFKQASLTDPRDGGRK